MRVDASIPPKPARAPQAVYYDRVRDARDVADYYRPVGPALNSNPKDFGLELSHHLWQTHTTHLAYDPKHELYPWVDLRPSLRLQSLYSSRPVDTGDPLHGRTDPQATELAAALASAPTDAVELAARVALAETRKYYNCEHVVPKIWFDNEAVPEGDLHHLFAAQKEVNAERSSYRLGELSPQQRGPSILGEGWLSECSGTFEPAAGKGEAARAILYFLIRYPGKVGDHPTEFRPQDLATLLRWHREYPVTLHEQHRNQAIFEVQGNRNPLIDHPEWADKIDFQQFLGKVQS